MVLYFSGTGNSQFVAVRIAELTGDGGAVSINRYLKDGTKAVIQSERPLVFVAPTYAWRMPRVVERWIQETSFQGCRDAYFILTCGGGCGSAAAYAKRLCGKNGLRFCGLAPVVMPENYLALFPTPSEAESRRIVEEAEPIIAVLGEKIRCGQRFDDAPASLRSRVESGPVNPLFYALLVHDKGFSVSDGCVSCGKCVRRCPLDNIVLTGGRPVWKGNCTHCMACIGSCPAGAIEYKTRSKGRRRHDMMDESLLEKNGGGTAEESIPAG